MAGEISLARLLVIGLQLNDSGFTAGLSRANAAASALRRGMSDTDRSIAGTSAGMGLFGVASAAALAGSVVAFGSFQKAVTEAALATGGQAGLVGRVQELDHAALHLSQTLHQTPTAMAEVLVQVEKFHVGTQAAKDALTEAGVKLGYLSGQAAPEVSLALFRLAKDTSRSADELDRNAASALGAASAIYAVGNMSAGGVKGIEEFQRRLQLLGVTAKFSQAEIIAISGALAEVNERLAGTSASSIIRDFAKVIPKNEGAFAKFLGISPEELRALSENNPAELLQRLMVGFAEARKGGEDLNTVFTKLGVTNVRDIQTWDALIAEVARYPEFLAAAQEQMRDPSRINEAYIASLATQKGLWDQLTASISEFAVRAGALLSNVLMPLLSVLNGLLRVLAENPLLTMALTGGLLATSATFFGGILARAGGLGAILGIGREGAIGGALKVFNNPFAAGLEGLAAQPAIYGGARLGMFGLGQVAGALAGGETGMSVLSYIGTMATTLPIIGAVIAALALLAPVFKGLADTLQNMGKDGGIVGTLFSALSLLVRVLETLGNIINFVVGIIVKAVTSIPFVGDLFAGINGGLQNLNTGLEQWNQNILKSPASGIVTNTPAAPAPVTINYQANMNVQGNGTAELLFRDNAHRVGTTFGSVSNALGKSAVR